MDDHMFSSLQKFVHRKHYKLFSFLKEASLVLFSILGAHTRTGLNVVGGVCAVPTSVAMHHHHHQNPNTKEEALTLMALKY